MPHDVFISYVNKDRAIANQVLSILEKNKISVWIAPRDIPSGSDFLESISDAINRCKVFCLIWSNNAITSKTILNEVKQAFEKGKIIIPFYIQNFKTPEEILIYFSNIPSLDAFYPPLENHLSTLKKEILEILNYTIPTTPINATHKVGSKRKLRKIQESSTRREGSIFGDSSNLRDIKSERTNVFTKWFKSIPNKTLEKTYTGNQVKEILREKGFIRNGNLQRTNTFYEENTAEIEKWVSRSTDQKICNSLFNGFDGVVVTLIFQNEKNKFGHIEKYCIGWSKYFLDDTDTLYDYGQVLGEHQECISNPFKLEQ